MVITVVSSEKRITTALLITSLELDGHTVKTAAPFAPGTMNGSSFDSDRVVVTDLVAYRFLVEYGHEPSYDRRYVLVLDDFAPLIRRDGTLLWPYISRYLTPRPRCLCIGTPPKLITEVIEHEVLPLLYLPLERALPVGDMRHVGWIGGRISQDEHTMVIHTINSYSPRGDIMFHLLGGGEDAIRLAGLPKTRLYSFTAMNLARFYGSINRFFLSDSQCSARGILALTAMALGLPTTTIRGALPVDIERYCEGRTIAATSTYLDCHKGLACEEVLPELTEHVRNHYHFLPVIDRWKMVLFS